MTDSTPRDPSGRGDVHLLDELFDGLRKRPRRRILTALTDAKSRHEAEFVRATGTDEEQVADGVLRLHHVHLPKLEAAGFIEWNVDSQPITRGPRFDEIAPLLALLLATRDQLPADWPSGCV